MTDYTITSVSRMDGSMRTSHELSMSQTESAAQAQPEKTAQPAKQEHKEGDSLLPVTENSSVALKFRVDEDSNEITVFIVDRATQKVLRSIPPDEVSKLHAGDILKLVA